MGENDELATRDLQDKMRAAWNNYVFARMGMPPGPGGVAMVSEEDAFDKLSVAFRELTAMWDDEA
jgi:hypothetical protein